MNFCHCWSWFCQSTEQYSPYIGFKPIGHSVAWKKAIQVINIFRDRNWIVIGEWDADRAVLDNLWQCFLVIGRYFYALAKWSCILPYVVRYNHSHIFLNRWPSTRYYSRLFLTGRGSLIGCVFAWHASGPEFDPHVRHILSWRYGHENIFYGHSPSSADSWRAVVSYWQKNVH